MTEVIWQLSCPQPYEWLPVALRKLAGSRSSAANAVYRQLLEDGVRRGALDLSVPKSLLGARAPTLDKIEVTAATLNALDQLVDEVAMLATKRVRGLAAEVLAKASSATDGRGWLTADGGVAIMLVGAKLPVAKIEKAACEHTTIDRLDVIRAVLAREFEMRGLAPMGWRAGRVVHSGWPKQRARRAKRG